MKKRQARGVFSSDHHVKSKKPFRKSWKGENCNAMSSTCSRLAFYRIMFWVWHYRKTRFWRWQNINFLCYDREGSACHVHGRVGSLDWDVEERERERGGKRIHTFLIFLLLIRMTRHLKQSSVLSQDISHMVLLKWEETIFCISVYMNVNQTRRKIEQRQGNLFQCD